MSEFVSATTKSPAPGQRWSNLESFGAGQLAGTAGTLYTAPSAASTSGAVTSLAILRDMWLCNTDTVDRTATLHIVASGGSATAANMIMPAVTITAGQSLHYSGLATLIPAGGTIQGLASSANKITYVLTGEVIR